MGERTTTELSSETIEYALRCAANWLNERCNPDTIDADDERGRILRWERDNPDED